MGDSTSSKVQQKQPAAKARQSVNSGAQGTRLGAAEGILALQHAAGNRAVSRGLQVRGQDKDEAVFPVLRHLVRSIPAYRNAAAGRIRGDTLETGSRSYQLYTADQLPEGLTLSATLGSGVFFLQPAARQRAKLAALMAGAAFEIQRVAGSGQRRPTGVVVIAAGLDGAEGGIVAYSPKTIYLAETRIEARKPRDTAALTERVTAIMDTVDTILAPATAVATILFALREQNLTSDEMTDILSRLDGAHRLGEFLNLVRLPEFRAFLKEKDVLWEYIYEHWEPNVNDSGLFFAGFLVGAAENVVDLVKFVYTFVGSIWDEEKARDMRQMISALGQFFAHPLVTAQAGIKLLYDSFTKALWELEFFEAGRIAGNVVVFLLTLPSFIKSLPKAARALVRSAVVLARLTLSEAYKFGVMLKELAEMVNFPRPALVTNAGIVLMNAGEDVTVIGKGGNTLGNISKAEIIKATATTGTIRRPAVKAGEKVAEGPKAKPTSKEAPAEKTPAEKSPAEGAAVVSNNEPVIAKMSPEKPDLIKFWEEQIKREPSKASTFKEYIRRIEEGDRPTWRQTEREMAEYYKQIGGREEISFKENQMVERGTSGSTRPDIVQSIMIEAKNYKLENKSKLIAALKKQIEARRLEGMLNYAWRYGTGTSKTVVQSIILDFRGQDVAIDSLKALAKEVSEATGVPIDHIQIVIW